MSIFKKSVVAHREYWRCDECNSLFTVLKGESGDGNPNMNKMIKEFNGPLNIIHRCPECGSIKTNKSGPDIKTRI